MNTPHQMKHFYAFTAILLLAMAPARLQAQLPNDECVGALGLTVGATCIGVEQDAATATQSRPPVNCNPQFSTASQAHDLWYSFTGNGHVMKIQATGLGDVDIVLELFQGACAELAQISCVDATYQDGGTEELTLNSVLGTLYTFRVFPYLTSHADFEYTVCVFETGLVGIAEANGHQARLFVHPNPSNGDITVTLPDYSGPVHIAISDALGRTLYTGVHTPNNGVMQLSLSDELASGSYFIHARSDSRMVSRSLTIE